MENDVQRSGHDRRIQEDDAPEEKRDGTERRAAVKNAPNIIDVLRKIPLFRGLNFPYFQKILNISSQKIFEKDEYVCKESETPDEMYILIDGLLEVVYHEKTVITTLRPISIVCELFIFTGEKGFSSVKAAEKSTVIAIHKNELLKLLQSDSTLAYRIFTNVISALTDKLRKDNEIIAELQKKAPPG